MAFLLSIHTSFDECALAGDEVVIGKAGKQTNAVLA